MAKGYWVSFFRSVSNAEAITEYIKLAGPVIEAGGGRIVARGLPVKVYEAGLKERSVVIEFGSVEQAIATYESPQYQAALELLKNGVERDLRILEGA
jgi:uncharacterized protein (DUF1330 family)